MRSKEPRTVIGIDGEGLNIGSNHLYCYMAACGTDQEYGAIQDMKGLDTQTCFEFLLSLPKKHLKFGFSLGYDYTKILESMPNKKIWQLTHPEHRPGNRRPKAVFWTPTPGGVKYKLSYISGCLRIGKILPGYHNSWCKINHVINCQDGECEGCRSECKGCKIVSSVTIWDIFKFFQASFINACKDWGVITDEEYKQLKEMKDKRGTFVESEWKEVQNYCIMECKKLAELGEKLIQAHVDAGLNLTQYHGAGSTGAAMLKSMGAQNFMMRRVTGDKGKDSFRTH